MLRERLLSFDATDVMGSHEEPQWDLVALLKTLLDTYHRHYDIIHILYLYMYLYVCMYCTYIVMCVCMCYILHIHNILTHVIHTSEHA